MGEDSNNIKVELAKSYFKGAEMLIILTGLLFATAGIYYSSAENQISEVRRITTSDFPYYIDSMMSNINNVCVDFNFSKSYVDVLETSINASVYFTEYLSKSAIKNIVWWGFFMILGIIAFFSSISFYIKGRKELKKLLKKK